jgi:beta-glucanase (GH16 family)
VSPPPGSGNLVFDDEFNGASVDTSKWRVRNNSWAANELSIDTSRPSNVFVSNGVLTLRAQREQYTVGSTTRSYTSGYLDTIGLSGHEYGRWEMRAKLPSAQGLWPAFWLRGDHSTGEIDILEAIGGLPQMTVQTVFPNTNDGSVKKSHVDNFAAGDSISAWHVYGFTWTPTSMTWDIDGVTAFRLTSTDASWVSSSFQDTMNIRLNLQVGGTMPNYFSQPVDGSSPLPGDYQVDYVRVYSQ